MERSFLLEGKVSRDGVENGAMDRHESTPITEVELLELLVRAPRTALDNAPCLVKLFTRLVELQPEPTRDRFLAAVPPADKTARGAGAGVEPGERPFLRCTGTPISPPEALLERALLHGRGRAPRTIMIASLAKRVGIAAEGVADALNDASLMVSLPADSVPRGIGKWRPVFQLATALGTTADEVRVHALIAYADRDVWEQAHLPVDEAADDLLRWIAHDFVPRGPAIGAQILASFLSSPEALHTAAGYLLGELPRIDLSVFRPLLATLAQFDRAGRLVREHPTRGLVQELVRYAVEVSGDPSDAATGLAVLFAHSPNTSALPTATDLALASTVATSVVAGRTGWRYPHLRPAMLEAALHGAPGCRRAALMLEAW